MGLNSLDLNLVRVLDALLRERSVTRAGERLGLSQPAVSAALARLRNILNDQLFVRSGNDMLPTPRAEGLAVAVRSALSVIERAFETGGPVDPRTLDRTCTLLGADFFSMLLMPRLSACLAEEAPGVRVRLVDSALGDVARLLKDDAIDAALERPLDLPDWVSSAFLFRSPFAIIASRRNSRLAPLDLPPGAPVPMDLFCALPHAIRSIDGSMSGFTDDALGEAGAARRVTLALPHFQGVALAVAESDLVASVPCQFAEFAARDLKLALYRPPIAIPVPEIRMYWHARHDDAREHAWMRSRILDLVRNLGFDEAADRYL